MQNQQFDHPMRSSRTVKTTVQEGSRDARKGRLYQPTVHHPNSYRSSDGASDSGQRSLFNSKPPERRTLKPWVRRGCTPEKFRRRIEAVLQAFDTGSERETIVSNGNT